MHTLYRFYAAEGTLLYVGITNNPPRRFSKHRDEKSWWRNVARIEMEQFESREQLAAAERRAISDEAPAHNVRMNGARPASPMPSTAEGLVGRWFHSYEPMEENETSTSHLDGRGSKRVWQGQVVDREGPLLILQLYSWFDGAPTNQVVYPIDGMGSWKFYENNEQMHIADGCPEYFMGSPSNRSRGRIGECGAPCTHVIRNGDLGPIYRCHNCIEFYSGKVEEL